jgi:hypothetical protein
MEPYEKKHAELAKTKRAAAFENNFANKTIEDTFDAEEIDGTIILCFQLHLQTHTYRVSHSTPLVPKP